MYYNVKLSWKQPKEETDEFQKFTKTFLVNALSVTEAEANIIDWAPGNYQDPLVSGATQINIGEIRTEGDSETFWLVKVMDDLDGTAAKPKPYLVLYNANHLEDAVRKASKDWSGSEIEEVKKYKNIVDEDLINEPKPKNYGTVVTPSAPVEPA